MREDGRIDVPPWAEGIVLGPRAEHIWAVFALLVT